MDDMKIARDLAILQESFNNGTLSYEFLKVHSRINFPFDVIRNTFFGHPNAILRSGGNKPLSYVYGIQYTHHIKNLEDFI